jgi:hypothetical protein
MIGTTAVSSALPIPATGMASGWVLGRCLAGGGALTLWCGPLGSPHGRITYQTACAGTVYADYTKQAAKHDRTQLFLCAVLWLVAVLSFWRLAVNVWHQYQRP